MIDDTLTREIISKRQSSALLNRLFTRAKIVCACGTGKTRLELQSIETITANLTLVVVPFISLIAQSLQEFKDHQTTKKKYLIICSDRAVSTDPRDAVSMDLNEIISFMKSDDEKVIFITYTSTPKLAECYKECKDLIHFDLIIFDEAHLSSSNKLDSAFSTALLDSNIPASLRLFYTATERLSQDQDGFSMDNRLVYGDTIVAVSNADAVASRIIKPFKIITAVVSTETAQKLINDNKIIGTELANISADAMAKHITLAKSIRAKDIKTVMAFHHTIAEAMQMAKEGNLVASALGIPHMKHLAVSSNDSITTINAAFDELRAGNTILHNVRIGAIGINIKNLDAVFFNCIKTSTYDITQIIGRTQRMQDEYDLEASYAIVPLITDDLDELIGFKKLLTILSNLARNVPTVSIAPQNSSVVSPIRTINRGSMEILSCDETLDQSFIDSIHLSIQSEFKSANEKMLFADCALEYAQYVEQNLAYPREFIGEGSYLATWARKQRLLKDSNNLPDDLKEIVDRALPEFIWGGMRKKGFSFFSRLALARIYYRLHKKHIPIDHHLAEWFRQASRPYISAQNNLSRDQWDEVDIIFPGFLAAIGVIFDEEKKPDKDYFLFIKKISQLREYVANHGVFPMQKEHYALHVFQRELATDLTSGKAEWKKKWLEDNWQEYFTTSNSRINSAFNTSIDKIIDLHLSEMPAREAPGYFACKLMIAKAREDKLTQAELDILKMRVPFLYSLCVSRG